MLNGHDVCSGCFATAAPTRGRAAACAPEDHQRRRDDDPCPCTCKRIWEQVRHQNLFRRVAQGSRERSNECAYKGRPSFRCARSFFDLLVAPVGNLVSSLRAKSETNMWHRTPLFALIVKIKTTCIWWEDHYEIYSGHYNKIQRLPSNCIYD
jgi:hypothetical protein